MEFVTAGRSVWLYTPETDGLLARLAPDRPRGDADPELKSE